MKKLLSIAILLASVSLTTFAQESTKIQKEGRKHDHRKEMTRKSPEEIAKMKTDHLDKIVKLSDKQKEEVYALSLKQAKARQDNKESRKKDREAGEAKMKASREELNKILTPEQQRLMSENAPKKGGKRMTKPQAEKKIDANKKQRTKTQSTVKSN